MRGHDHIAQFTEWRGRGRRAADPCRIAIRKSRPHVGVALATGNLNASPKREAAKRRSNKTLTTMSFCKPHFAFIWLPRMDAMEGSDDAFLDPDASCHHWVDNARRVPA